MGRAELTRRTVRRRRSRPRHIAGGEVARQALERWLCDPVEPVPLVHDLADVFGPAYELRADPDDRVSLTRRLRLIVAVLRDTFASDDAARDWMHASNASLAGLRPLDLLARGRLAELEARVIEHWHRAAEPARMTSSA